MSWITKIFARPGGGDQSPTSKPTALGDSKTSAPPAPSVPDNPGLQNIDTSVVSIDRAFMGLINSAMPRQNLDSLIGRKGIKVYSDMRVDEQVKAVCVFKRDAILCRGWHFEFDKESKLSDEEKAKRIRIFEKIIELKPGTFIDDLNVISVGREFGYSLTEKVYAPVEIDGKTWVGLNSLRGREPISFEFKTDPFGDLVSCQQIAGGMRIDIDLDKFIHYVHNPEFDVYLGRSDLREAYRAWYFKDMLIKYWALYMEKLGGGALIVSVGAESNISSSTSKEYLALKSIAENFKAASGIVLPKGVTATLAFPTNSDAFDKAITWMDLAIARALLVPNLLGVSHTGQTGAYSQSQTQLETFAWTLRADTERLQAVINEQLFYDLGEQNWGDGEYPCFKFKPATTDAMKWMLTSLKDMLDAGAIVATEDDEKKLREILELPQRDPKAKPLVNPAAEADKQHELGVLDKTHELGQAAADAQVKRGINEDKTRATDPILSKAQKDEIKKYVYESVQESQQVIVAKLEELKKFAFDESQHPRDNHGRFGEGGTGSDKASSSVVSRISPSESVLLSKEEAAKEKALGEKLVSSLDKKDVAATDTLTRSNKSFREVLRPTEWSGLITSSPTKEGISVVSKSGTASWLPREHLTAAGFSDNREFIGYIGRLRNAGKAAGRKFSAAPSARDARISIAGARERVDFAVIDQKQKLYGNRLAQSVGSVVAAAVRKILGDDKQLAALTDSDTSDIANVDLSGVDRGRIKALWKQGLADAWALGRNMGDEEIRRVNPQRKIKHAAHFASLKDKSIEYFENNGFRMAGNVSDGVRAVLQQELQNSVKAGKTPTQTRETIWDRLTSKGFVSRDNVREVEEDKGVIDALDSLWLDDEAQAAHYLDTLARTNLFESMNEARYGEFTDPALDGFVVALRYSAVLDDRTTDICEGLDGHVHEADSEVWDTYRPPNHFNCRSILVPITELDVQSGEWDGEVDEDPKEEGLFPQEGFK